MLLIASRFPVVTLALTAVVFAVHTWPGAAAGLQLERAAVAVGEWWRLVAGHFTHWSADHLVWDVLVFALLGAACEVTSRRRMLITLGIAIVAIPLAVLLWQPQFHTYRGLSGLDSALFGLLAFDLLREKLRESHHRAVVAIGLLIVAFIAKAAFESLTGSAVFADSAAGGFVPVPLAHLVGFVSGAITSVACALSRNRFRRQSARSSLRWPAI